MSIQDSSPLIRSGYDAKASPSVAGEPSHTVKQVKGDFATNGVQPSFALELDISTIKHVRSYEYLLMNFAYKVRIGMVR